MSAFPLVLCGLEWHTLLFRVQVKQVERQHLKNVFSFLNIWDGTPYGPLRTGIEFV